MDVVVCHVIRLHIEISVAPNAEKKIEEEILQTEKESRQNIDHDVIHT